MIETVIEKGTVETPTHERESPILPQEKLGPPRDEWAKKTKAEGARIDLCLQRHDQEYVDLYVHQRGLSIAHRLKKPKRHEQYNFAEVDVEELNDIVIKGIPKRPHNSQRIMAGLYRHEYLHTEETERIIYESVREIHRTFGRG